MTFNVYSIGFSNRTWDETFNILTSFEIRRLIDVRTLPGSKHTPHFNYENLHTALPKAGIDYVHMKSLGGLRKPSKTSFANSAWRNDSFRGYADYMQTPEFDAALDELIRLITEMRTVYACTEAVFWRCHRQLISDALFIRGYKVGHIFNASKVEPHKPTSFMKVDEYRITYPSLIGL